MSRLITFFIESKDFMLPCMNKKIFGIDCPGCGVQRSLAHIIKGEFTEAFYMYPAIYTLIFLALFMMIQKRFKFKFGKKIILTLVITNVTIIVISYIIKMNTIYLLI